LIGTAFREQLTDQSDITASSALGSEFNGVVEIKSPENDPSAGVVDLAEEVVDVDRLIAPGCPVPQLSRLVVTGKGGLSSSPASTLQNAIVWQDLRSPEFSTPVAQEISWQEISQPIQQAQTWQLNSKGQVELIASKFLEMSYQPGNCSHSN
jgi:large exoprotein involved in heme utilization and adhesion